MKQLILIAGTAMVVSSSAGAAVLTHFDFEVANEGVSSTPLSPAAPTPSIDTNSDSTSTGVTLSGLAVGTGGNGSGPSGAESSKYTSHRTGVHDYATGQYGTGSPNNWYNGSGGQNGNGTTSLGAMYLSKNDVANGATTSSSSDYISFGVSANAGNQLNLATLKFFLLETNNDNAVFSVYYSTNSFTDSALLGTANTAIPESYGSAFSFDLSTIAALQSVPSSSAVGFRIYVADGTQSSGGRSLRFDDIIIEGTVVPEPSALAAMASLSPLALRRRRSA
jgi:hypothetical protein